MSIPIVLVAFGTTTKALDTYRFMDSIYREAFIDHEIVWAYSSRMIKDWIKQRKNIDLRHPHEVILELASMGHKWVVVQSLHLICGHEFYRMVEEVHSLPVRTSIGLPLLAELQDYHDLARAFKPLVGADRETAYVFVGHGTDHPSWTGYLALESVFRKLYGDNVFVGVVEGYPSRDEVIGAISKRGFKKAHLIPLMLVAGTHFYEDLYGDENSWEQSLEEEGIRVTGENKGLGYMKEIVDIFCRHIDEALDIIVL